MPLSCVCSTSNMRCRSRSWPCRRPKMSVRIRAASARKPSVKECCCCMETPSRGVEGTSLAPRQHGVSLGTQSAHVNRTKIARIHRPAYRTRQKHLAGWNTETVRDARQHLAIGTRIHAAIVPLTNGQTLFAYTDVLMRERRDGLKQRHPPGDPRMDAGRRREHHETL